MLSALAGSLTLAVAVVARSPGYDTSLANHLGRWLGQEGVSARVVQADAMSGALAKERLAFLVGFANPSASEMATLRAFRARGGRLVVFHSASKALADLMGVKPVGYAAAPYPGAYSRMSFSSATPAGLPSSIRQTSGVLQRARPVEGRSRTIATWCDRRGKSTGEPAWIMSDAGFWMTHVLLADGDEDQKARLLGAIAGYVDPSAWSIAAHRRRVSERAAATRTLAMKQVRRDGEIHAVWEHSGCGLYPGDWARTFRVLRESRVTDLFVNVAGFAFAHYASDVLPRSKTFADEGDQLAACLAAARGTGIRVHAWVVCFSATRGTPAARAEIARRGWLLKTPKGADTEYVDPSNAQVRARVLDAISEMQRKHPSLAGIHLDFVRWGDAAAKPRDAAAPVTRFVADARRRVPRPRWLTAAVYGKYPQCVASVGQDWGAWLDAGLVDYAAPMNYAQSNAAFAELLAMQATPRSRARRLIAGIGVTANESRLDARQAIEQALMARRAGFAGVALFDLDATLERQVLPYLRLGLW